MNDKAIIYNRVSTAEQNAKLQLKECEDYCNSKGWVNLNHLYSL